MLAFYGGRSSTAPSDLRLRRPDGTDLSYRGVAWADESFKAPRYWGLRLAWWPEPAAHWGAALELTHAKISADLAQPVEVTGTRAGAPVSGREPLGASFGSLAFTHGHNLLTANALYRWRSWPVGDLGLRPYAGAGAGVAVPHVEITLAGEPAAVFKYQVAGPAVQVFAGLALEISTRVALFAELKASVAALDADVAGGGSLRFTTRTRHAAVGAALRFR